MIRAVVRRQGECHFLCVALFVPANFMLMVSKPLKCLFSFCVISFIIHESASSHFDSSRLTIYPAKVKQVSYKPRAFVYQDFLTDEECDHLIILAKDELKRSDVTDPFSGETVRNDIRTSSGMFIPKGQDPIVVGIEEKIAAWTFLPTANGENLQVLKYEPGQKYGPHQDYFDDEANIARGGHRMATVLMYLTDVVKGGETVFPDAEESPDPKSNSTRDDLSECARQGVAVKPRRGDALLFFSLHVDATPDPISLHGGCPVIEGEKWVATKWIHVGIFV